MPVYHIHTLKKLSSIHWWFVKCFTITILLSFDKIQGDIDKNEELMDTWGERRVYILNMEREKDGIIIIGINKGFFAYLLLANFYFYCQLKRSVKKGGWSKIYSLE